VNQFAAHPFADVQQEVLATVHQIEESGYHGNMAMAYGLDPGSLLN